MASKMSWVLFVPAPAELENTVEVVVCTGIAEVGCDEIENVEAGLGALEVATGLITVGTPLVPVTTDGKAVNEASPLPSRTKLVGMGFVVVCPFITVMPSPVSEVPRLKLPRLKSPTFPDPTLLFPIFPTR